MSQMDRAMYERENWVMKWSPPLYEDVLVFVEFLGDEVKPRPRIMVAYTDEEGIWRTSHGRLRGTVTHWRRLPNPPID